MKKVTEAFVCDCCGKQLPTKFVKRNEHGVSYFDRRSFNTVYVSPYGKITVDLGIEVSEYGPDYKELCDECMAEYIRLWLTKKGGDEE